MSATTRPKRSQLAIAREWKAKRQTWLVAATIAIAITYLGLDGGGYGTTERSAFGVVIWLIVLAFLTFSRPVGRALPSAALVVGATILLFAAVTGLSVFWSESAGRSFLELARVGVYLGIFTATVLAVRVSSRRAAVDGLVIGTGLVTFLAVLSRLWPALFPAQEYQRLDPESAARLTYPLNYWNGLAAFIALGVALLLYQSTRDDVNRHLRALGTAFLPVAGLGLYLTLSRGGVGTAVLACALTLALSPRRVAAAYALVIGVAGTLILVALVRSYRALNDGLIETSAARSEGHKVLLLLIVVSALAYGAALLRDPLARRLPARVRELRLPRRSPVVIGILLAAGAVAIVLGAGTLSDRWERFKDPVVFQGDVSTDNIESRLLSSSGNGRYQYWSASWDAFRASPIGGRGAGTWDFWWRRNATAGGGIRDSHSLFFDVIAELGALGIITLIALLGSIIWAAASAWRRAGPADRPLEAALVAITVAFVFHAAFDWIWELAAVGAVFFVAAGVAVWGKTRLPSIPAARMAGAGVAVAAIAWLAIFTQAIPLLSNWKLTQSENHARDGDLDRALRAAKAAHTIEPWAGGPLLQIALVREEMAPNGDAIAAAAEAVRNEPTNWEPWFVLARIEAEAGQLDAAAEHLEIARRLNPLSSIWQRINGAEDLVRGG